MASSWSQLRNLLFAASIALLGGCAATVRESAQAAAPAAVDAAVDEADEPDNRNRIARILADPDVQKSVEGLAQSAGAGVLDSLSEAEREAQLARLTDQLVAQVGRALATSLEKDIGPAVSTMVADAVDRSLQAALDSERLERVGASITEGALRGFADFASQNQGMTQTVGLVARSVGREAALGFQDAVHATEAAREQHGRDSGDVLAAAGRAADLTLGVTPFLLLGGGLVTLLLIAGLVWTVLRLRQQRRELGELRRLQTTRSDGPPFSGHSAYAG